MAGSVTGRIAILVKTPGRSPVKTRLAASLGTADAEACFTRSAAAVAATVQAFLRDHPGWTAAWHVVEPDAVDDPRWSGLPDAVWAGPGDLGVRMRAAWTTGLRDHGAALILGGDVPAVRPDDLRDAAAHLAAGRTVIGPALDGGFWCVGGTRPLPDAAWTDTPWSRPDTRARFVAATGVPVTALRTLPDLDTADDIPAVLAALDPPATPAHAALADFARTLRAR